ncbi:hypothetical protein ACFQMJ_31210 [Cohnella cellulosilytica]|uniref:Uncharacterized protein n=2 Tax=Cohnella cellulosilytica TaxID=986710 RepID=A0ABW2FLQ7_9BACL
MRKNKMMKAMQGLLATALVAVIAFGSSGNAVRAAEVQASEATSGAVALTAAPPIELFSVFNPNHLYLENGVSTITPTKGKVTVSATTVATRTVDSIGLIFYVQKWTGSSWDTVGAGSTVGTNNDSVYHNTFEKTVEAGYYYRARTIHWVIHNGVYEEGETITSSVLGV